MEMFQHPDQSAGLEVATPECGLERVFNRFPSPEVSPLTIRFGEERKRVSRPRNPPRERKRPFGLTRTALWIGGGLFVVLVLAVVGTALGFSLAVMKMHDLNEAHRLGSSRTS